MDRARLARIIFFGYAIVLFVTTHWPRLKVPPVGDFTRLDLIIHAGAFATWTYLLSQSGLIGRPSRRWHWGVLAWVVGALYAAFDEGTQAIPVLGRTAAWDDFGANLLGVTLGVAVAIATRPAAGMAARAESA